ncbi:hypothetical protein E3N88_43917 [Mikania micrantha]|uniref:Uncharacterized protein n=1 Tax=Mikania micrantha TaxID=192012 RepID=A0A5N6LDQ6_9ASTR|nr:hypothetical protein E3N88_43917 [Mikania micrantha]
MGFQRIASITFQEVEYLNSSTLVWGYHIDNSSSIRPIPKAIEGELVVAGWPSWLVEVAGEAINGWLPRRADTLEKLELLLGATHYGAHVDLGNAGCILGELYAGKPIIPVEPRRIQETLKDFPHAAIAYGDVTYNISWTEDLQP